MSDVLAEICAAKRDHIARAKAALPEAALRDRLDSVPPLRPFAAALENRLAHGHCGLIAEIKKASPSRGLIRADFDPPSLAQAYAAGGATCLSVLTDTPYFQGNDQDLHQIVPRVARPWVGQLLENAREPLHPTPPRPWESSSESISPADAIPFSAPYAIPLPSRGAEKTCV